MSERGPESRLESLLDEFVHSHLRGELPDPAAFVSRAGEEAPRLRELIGVFLAESAPVPANADAARRLAERYGAAPLPAESLLDEFVHSHLRGELPDPAAFVSRAGEEAPRLRELIGVFLAESAPVPANADAARRLGERYGAAPLPAEETDAAETFSWRRTLLTVLDAWVVAPAPRRRELLDGCAEFTSVLSLEPVGSRHRTQAGQRDPITLIQFNHPPGARAEVHDDGLLTLTIFGLPAQFVGSRPLVAFPRAQSPDDLDMSWCSGAQGLPDGIARADREIRERRELRVTVGRLEGERRQLDSLLSEVRVLGIPDEVI